MVAGASPKDVGDGCVQPDAVARLFNSLATPDRRPLRRPTTKCSVGNERSYRCVTAGGIPFCAGQGVHRRASTR